MQVMALPRQWRGRVEDAHLGFRASTFSERAYTVDVVWTTGARVRRSSWSEGPFDEELVVEPGAVRLDRLNRGGPFLDSHRQDLSCVIGSVVPGSARIERGQGVATIQLSRGEAEAPAVSKIRDGIVRSVSVGYAIHKAERSPQGDGKADLMRVTDWEPLEISAVAIPADAGAHIRSADQRHELFSATIVNVLALPHVAATRARMQARQAAVISTLPAGGGREALAANIRSILRDPLLRGEELEAIRLLLDGVPRADLERRLFADCEAV